MYIIINYSHSVQLNARTHYFCITTESKKVAVIGVEKKTVATIKAISILASGSLLVS